MKKELRVIVPEKLYKEFQKKCKLNFKTISEVIRDLMLNYKDKK